MNEEMRTLPTGRERLVRVLEQAGDVVRIDDVVTVLGVGRSEASKQLSRWKEQGWLRRVGSGAYISVPLDMLDAEQVLDDPWVLVPHLFSPCYVGGWTAAEHWDLTEQLFRSTFVCTARSIRSGDVHRQGMVFDLRRIQEHHIFGTRTVWRRNTKVQVADIHRTVIDMLNNPAWGGGIDHVSECLDRYAGKTDFAPDKLLQYADRIDNGALHKRLGFLAELKGLQSLADQCHTRLTKGYARIDPDLECTHLVTRWRLWVPRDWKERTERL